MRVITPTFSCCPLVYYRFFSWFADSTLHSRSVLAYEFYDDEDRCELKKRLLTYAFEEMSVFGSGLDEVHIYLNPQEKIRPEQIVSITAI